jgi:hypothetical protein
MAISSAPAVSHAADPRRIASSGEHAAESRIRAASRRHRERLGDAAASRDASLDVIVILSVLMFIALVIGVGLLVLGPTLHWPH